MIAVIASEASNPSLKHISPKQTRTNSVFAKICKDEELRHSKCISYHKIPRIHYISILPAKLINILKNLVVMSLKWCSNVILTVPLANATDTMTLSWQWLDAFVALSLERCNACKASGLMTKCTATQNLTNVVSTLHLWISSLLRNVYYVQQLCSYDIYSNYINMSFKLNYIMTSSWSNWYSESSPTLSIISTSSLDSDAATVGTVMLISSPRTVW